MCHHRDNFAIYFYDTKSFRSKLPQKSHKSSQIGNFRVKSKRPQKLLGDCFSPPRMYISILSSPIARIQLKIMTFHRVLALAVLSFLFFMGTQSRAQTAGAQTTRYDLFGGYSYLRLDSKSYGYLDYSSLDGGNLAGSFHITPNFAATADLSATFAQNQHFYTFMAGPEASISRYHGRWFAHALFGKARNGNEIPGVGSSLGRSIAVGGGYDYPFLHRFSIRVFQADYMNTHTYNVSQSNLRVSAGIDFHFGKTLK